jgi:lipopolysaccharide heptosyltransferase II
MMNYHLNIKNRNIHVINPHGIGDVIMMVPLVVAILRNNPRQLSFTLKSKLEAEVLQLFFAEQSFNFIFMQSIYENKIVSALISYIKCLQKLHLDLIFTAYGTNPQQASIVSFLSGASVRIGWENVFGFLNTASLDMERGLHKVNKHLNLLGNEPKQFARFPYEIFKSDKDKIEGIIDGLFNVGVDHRKDCLIAIAPGSGDLESHKRWPIDKYKELIDRFDSHNEIKFVLVGSKSELLLGNMITKVNNSKIINKIGELSITDTAHLLSLCKLAVCNCNGLSHLASGVGTKVIGLYGPTNPYLTGPYSDKFESISMHYNCSPCYKKGFIEGCGEAHCMTDIPVSSVYKQITSMLRLDK